MATEKLLAEWFWIDRWMGSSAFLLPLSARGLYREMLTQAWRRGARLPNDHDAIKRAVGATDEEWAVGWPLIEKYFRIKRGYLVSPTQVEIYRKSLAIQAARSDAGRRGGLKTQALKRQAKDEAEVETKSNSLTLSPSLRRTNTRTVVKRGAVRPDIRDHKRCDHEPRCHTRHACIERTLMEGRKAS